VRGLIWPLPCPGTYRLGVPILRIIPDEEHGFLPNELDRAPASGKSMESDRDSSRDKRRLALR